MLEGLFAPESIAVVGASREPRAVGRRILDALIAGPFEGPVYAVNPAADHIGAVPSHASIADIGRDIDLVVVAVPAEYVHEVIAEAADTGVRNAIVISAGFAEVDDEGAHRQEQLVDLAAEHGIRVVGPNCLGVLNTDPAARMNASFAPELPPRGDLGLCSQSGALGIAVIELAGRLGLGLSTFVSIGNQADVTVADVIEHWGDDDRTSAGMLYLESIVDPPHFRDIATRVSTELPLIAVKAGKTSQGSRAASSHTAALAGPARFVESLLRQSGVIRVRSLPDMFGTARILASQPRPAGRRAAVVTNSGGPGVLCVDALLAAGFEVAALSDAAQDAIAEHLPAAASVTNPIDMLADADADTYAEVVAEVLSLAEVDLLVVIYTPIGLEDDRTVREAIEGAVARAREDGAEGPVLLSVVGGSPAAGPAEHDPAHATQHHDERDDRETIPTFDFPEDLARLLGPIAGYCDWLEGDRGTVLELDSDDAAAIGRIIDEALDARGDGWLEVAEARQVLRHAGVPLNEGTVVGTADEAVRVAEKVGFPVAASISSTEIVHKTDVGAVRLDLGHADAVRAAYDELMSVADTEGAEPDGVLIATMESGTELFLGVQRDPRFGPLVAFGAGGTAVEVLDDVAFRLAPLTDRDANEMIREIKGWKLLEGHRGTPPAEAVADAVRRIAALASTNQQIVELDVNPLFAGPDGVVAVDVRISVQR